MSCNFETCLVETRHNFILLGSMSRVSVLNVILGCKMFININSSKIDNIQDQILQVYRIYSNQHTVIIYTK